MADMNVNGNDSAYLKASQLSREANAQQRNGATKIASSIWNTASGIVETTADGVVDVAEGVADLGIGLVKGTMAILKAPVALISDLCSSKKDEAAKAEPEPCPKPPVPPAPTECAFEEPGFVEPWLS